jgi:hypothetical protein
MKRAILMSALLGTFVAGAAGVVAAETPAPAKPQAAPAAHDHAHGPFGPPGEGGEGKMMCGHMMGGGMGMGMGGMGMGPMGPMMMGGPGTKVAVKNVDKGVTITLTAADAAGAVRLQKMAEAMRLMHEAMTAEK